MSHSCSVFFAFVFLLQLLCLHKQYMHKQYMSTELNISTALLLFLLRLLLRMNFYQAVPQHHLR